MNRSPVLGKVPLRLAALAFWFFLLWRAMAVFAPETDINNVGFNSDSAIPVLMSNESRPLGAYRLYYYGADRWGAWPFLVTRAIGQLTGHHWTDDSLFRVQALWVFGGVLVFASLSPPGARAIAGLFYLMALCLHREGRFLMFELSQVYGWQLTGVLLGWLALRRFYDATLKGPHGNAPWRQGGWLAATLGFSLIATWSSIASAVFLLFLLQLETARAWLRSDKPRPWPRLLASCVLALTAIAGAALIERQLKLAYREYAATHWGNPFATTFFVDWDYLPQNLSEQWRHLSALSWLPLYGAPLLVLAALGGALAYAILRQDRDLRVRLTTALTGDLALLTIGAYGIAAINLLLAVLVNHVRENDYDSRYLTLTNLFAPVSGMLSLYLLTTLVVGSARVRRFVQPAFALLAIVLLVAWFPTSRLSTDYEVLRETALTLARRLPNGVVLGSYWETYVFTALQPRNATVPVPFQGPFNRTPWTGDAVRRARQVVVGYPRDRRSGVSMPPRLEQYGCVLRLAEPHWYDNQRFAFGLYTTECR